mmetsp:Transcript_5097/g.15930  ORF Transcript_5097/g.15930 Transcript_5097/m.15930 type:complete len:254 (-) Transcript_5097:253-1014(-)
MLWCNWLTKYVAAAWFRALSNSKGLRQSELMSARESPAFSTINFCTLRISSWSTSSSASDLMESTRDSAHWPWKPRMTARSPSPRLSMSSVSTVVFDMAILLRIASFATTRSSSSVSFPRQASPASCPSSAVSPVVGTNVTVMSVTDWKIVDAIFLTCVSSFSRGWSTRAETKFESISEKPTIRKVTTISSNMFMRESFWCGFLKLKSQLRLAPSWRTELAFRKGGPLGNSHGSAASTSADSTAPSLAVSLYG